MVHFHRREAFEMEYRLRRHDGVYRWILDRGSPFFDDAEQFAGFIGSCIDIDDRRRAQDEHERRVLAGAHAFGSTRRSRQVRTGLARITRSADRIANVVEDLLDLTRVRRDGIPIQPRTSTWPRCAAS